MPLLGSVVATYEVSALSDQHNKALYCVSRVWLYNAAPNIVYCVYMDGLGVKGAGTVLYTGSVCSTYFENKAFQVHRRQVNPWAKCQRRRPPGEIALLPLYSLH